MVTIKKHDEKKRLLQEDEFLTLSERVFVFVQLHQRETSIALIIFVALTLSAAGYNYYSSRLNSSIAYDLSIAMNSADEASNAGVDVEPAIGKFQAVLNAYSQSHPETVASLYLGNLNGIKGDYEAAGKDYSVALKSGGTGSILGQMALLDISANLLRLEKFPEAVTEADKLISLAEQKIPLEEAYRIKAEALAKQNKNPESAMTLKTLLEKYPTVLDKAEIESRIKKLEGGQA